jgi:hypothetical protein
MYSFLLSSQTKHDVQDFDWFVYSKAAPLEVSANLTLTKGTKFGVKPHAISSASVQMIVHGSNRVFNVSMDRAKALARGVKKK